ncbi:MAG: hypothetical protein KDA67_08610 [Rhodobacteraceae bacterium]|nr:hypothetical protein [Paracoccaceae bacterium]
MPLMSLKSPRALLARLNAFGRDQSGATTIEWVILTASCLSLSIGLSALVQNGVERNAKNTAAAMNDYAIATSFSTASAASDADAGGKSGSGSGSDPSGGVSPGVVPAAAPASGIGGSAAKIGSAAN